MNQKVLIIGGAGYVGSVLTSHLLKLGHRVVCLDNFVYSNQFAVSPYIGDDCYRMVCGDMSDYSVLDSVSTDVDAVVILAGLVGDPITKKYPQASESINVESVKKCIDFFDRKEIKHLIFVSTCSNYGLISENELATEEYRLNPLSLYAKAKVSMEEYILSKKDAVGYSATVLRFATAFGLSPRMRFDLTVSEFTRDLYFKKELSVFDENTWRPYCHVRDFSRLIENLVCRNLNKPEFDVFNAGGDVNNFTKKMIVEEIQKRIPGSKVTYTANGSDPRNYRVSFEKIKEALGFEPKFTVRDGVEELISAFEIGLYADSLLNIERYGNYSINYSVQS